MSNSTTNSTTNNAKSTSSPKLWSILLTHGTARHIVKLDPATASLEDLFASAQAAFSTTAIASLLKPTPPRQVYTRSEDSSTRSTTTLQQAGLQANERLIVQVEQNSTDKGTTKKSKKKTKTPTTNKKKRSLQEDDDSTDDNDDEATHPAAASIAPRSSRCKRAAAQKATDSFAQVIQQQDEFLKTTQQKRSTPTKKPAPKKRTPRFTAAHTTGRRLHDGATTTTLPKPKRTKPTCVLDEQGENHPAMAALLAATNASTRGARIMRAGWKQAVQDAVEQNKAVARVAAVASGTYEIVLGAKSNVSTSTDDDTEQTMQVRFAKGVQGRGTFTDTVDRLPRDVLQSVIQAIHPTEALRPENLALLSPRVFWSIVENNNSVAETNNTNTNPAMDMTDALKELQPDLDWTFLRRRKQQLSAKARENLRQQNEASSNTTTQQDWQAAADAMESVEQAMGNLQALDKKSKQSRAAAAATNRLHDALVVVTPDETDVEELIECCSFHDTTDITNDHDHDDGKKEETKKAALGLQKKCNIHNWRELANADAETVASTLKSSQETVQGWIEQAQIRTIDELMVEICHGNVDAVRVLEEHAKSATPKDLAAWCGIADVLCEQLRGSGTGVADAFSVEQVEGWCQRAQQALEQLEWLNWYVTPVSES